MMSLCAMATGGGGVSTSLAVDRMASAHLKRARMAERHLGWKNSPRVASHVSAHRRGHRCARKQPVGFRSMTFSDRTPTVLVLVYDDRPETPSCVFGTSTCQALRIPLQAELLKNKQTSRG